MEPLQRTITRLLRAWGTGDSEAGGRLFGLVYDHLRTIARQRLERESRGHELDPEALVSEAFLRLKARREDETWQDRAHLYRLSSRIMRNVLVDYARRARSEKRDPLALSKGLMPAASLESPAVFLELDQALERLAAVDSRKALVVELRFFSGLTVQEVAEVLNLSPVTVKRDWEFARRWLYRELKR